ncbi:Carbohydrate binding module (family 6) [Cohnella sp. OV330]|uniref:carbohydrate-binding protein n=1 Tax=Cohnella sp. OV330 TaxID=1855288 RepID=UPI0008E92A50|nr:carbohydrate-binding protein [Cohnella sp. OV330]SFB55892.1 Carbohydrate binding module (family 6) [Cohnella sp. OV330]
MNVNKRYRMTWPRYCAALLAAALLLGQWGWSPSIASAASAFVQTAASGYSSQSGIQLETSAEGGQNVAFIDNGDYIAFANVDFGSGASTFQLRVASNASGGAIEARLDGVNGTLIATAQVPGTGGWQNWTTVTANASGASGVHTLYLKFTGGSGNLFNLLWFKFASGLSAFNQIEAEAYSSQSGIQTEPTSDAGGGSNVGFIDNGDYLLFAGVDFGSGASSVQARVASAAGGGSIEFRLDSLTGTLIGTVSASGTGGWQNWTTASGQASGATGIHNLYVKFTGGAGNLFNLNWFKFGTGAPTSGGDVVGKLFAGYQGWFNAQGDASPNGGWVHWSKNSSAPAAGSNVNFELYPDIREYSKLYQTNLANFGNGTQAKLFSSYDQETVNKHFEWMQTYNIDGAALQRFGADESDTPNNWKTNRDSVAVKVKNAAETYNRKFYVMYDITGMDASNWLNAVKHDWTTNVVNNMHLTTSNAYAKQNGKVVVCIWGIGFTDRPGTAAEHQNLINWFKAQNVYVIGGVPTYWRTGNNDSKPDFMSVYESLDMLSPWFVGRFGRNGLADVDSYSANQYGPDFTYTQQRNIAYQPVIWPGSAWSNMTGGPRNENPRLHGDFMWQQAYRMKQWGINTGYIAMFDEYDEGTAIAKIAENSSMIPTNQYFLTLDADGVALSSDFYLRLAGDINRMFKGQIPVTASHPTTHQ